MYLFCPPFFPHNCSLGGLGKDKSVACVFNIIVENISIQNTLSGVRIKTWQVSNYLISSRNRTHTQFELKLECV